MKNIVYCGPFDEVISEGLVFKKGEAVPAGDRLADSLLRQDFRLVPPVQKEKAK
jgi:hypothetical protein